MIVWVIRNRPASQYSYSVDGFRVVRRVSRQNENMIPDGHSVCHNDPLGTLMCLSIGTPKNNKFSIGSKWNIYYFKVSQN